MVEKPSYVFISYSRSDKVFVTRLMADLESAGVKVWIDKEGLKLGMPNFDQALRDALRSAYALLLVASPHSRRSNYVQGELEIAEMYDCPVYPVWGGGEKWADCVPLHMIKMQYADARGDSYPTGLAAILETLKSLAPGSAPSLPDAPVPAIEDDFEPRNPYKGLRAFREDDQTDFFGRQKLVETLLEGARNQPDNARLLAIVGPSGSGKSSIIMAGLLPRLRGSHLPGSQNWLYLDPTVPGTHPLRNLSVTLANALPERTHRAINEDLSDPEGLGLHLLAGQITRQTGKKLVIFIDQFEELFTQTVSEDERKQFINLLVSAVTEPRGPVMVLLTLRADFYDRPMASAPALAELLKAHHPILPMTIDDLRAVIEEPARLPDVKLTFDEGLVGDLLFETRDQAGGLPLLQFTLDQLFQRRQGQRLTLAAYQAIGGLRGALAKHAEATYTALPSEAHRKLAQALFLRLIEPGVTEQDTTRRRASLNELEVANFNFSVPLPPPTIPEVDDLPTVSKNQPRNLAGVMYETANSFLEARLLTADKEVIEVSHEALIREWPRLSDWLHEGRDDIRFHKTLYNNVTQWLRERSDDMLYRGILLRTAKDWARRNLPSQDEMAFINASISLENSLIAQDEQRKQELIEVTRQARMAQQAAQQATAQAEFERHMAQEAVEQSNKANETILKTAKRANQLRTAAIVAGLIGIIIIIVAVLQVRDAQKQIEIASGQVATAGMSLASSQIQNEAILATYEVAKSINSALQDQKEYAETRIAAQPSVFPAATRAADIEVLVTQFWYVRTILPTDISIAYVPQGWRLIFNNKDWKPINHLFEFEMVLVPSGCFNMGDINLPDARLVTQQCFEKPFWIDRYEVTNLQFNGLGAVARQTSIGNGDDQPRDSVRWDEALEFCRSKRNSRLPTEAEWEYAARGPDNWIYPWGNEFSSGYVVYSGNSDNHSLVVGSKAIGSWIGAYDRSWIGAYDMSGNLSEWTSTANWPYPYYPNDGREDSDVEALRVIRGGSFGDNEDRLKAAYRRAEAATVSTYDLGFRCARDWKPNDMPTFTPSPTVDLTRTTATPIQTPTDPMATLFN